MAEDLQATWVTLQDARDEWDQVADGLDGAWHRLHGASLADLDPAVAAASEAFRETWVDEVKRTAQSAQAHSEALDDAVRAYGAVDDVTFEQLRTLLPWEYRGSTLYVPPPTPAGP
ncbi:hypothetical protein RDV89_04405 [Nocardioides zeae]|uniref:PPE domain-containing protein n=1 Tax=Nocardioides imazamoxiresistens TaxID=3231893 RepID=A0ABU3PST1_9ACTN|nr:hypothetical protein [Nocardioides zeae]MDT9592293.1 hypothetical protein [Nocardioides zeae]